MTPIQIEEMVMQEWSVNGNNIFHACHTVANKTDFPAHQIMAFVRSQSAAGQSVLDTLAPHNWPRMQTEALDGDRDGLAAKIIQKDTLLGKMSQSVASMALFPENTVFAHALGVTASAMCQNFTYSVQSNYLRTSGNAVTLYICSAQPAGSAKSWVNGVLTAPLRDAYKEVNEERDHQRIRLKLEIERIEDELKKSGGGQVAERMEYELLMAKEQILGLGRISPAITDATPEALEIAAIEHGGFVNVISAEAESITVCIGGLYSEGKSTNMGLVLSMWDGDEEISIKRASRAAFSGKVKGCFVTISQDEGINALLEAGRSGRGISERFLIMREPELLGYRNLKDKKPLCEITAENYRQMIRALVLSEPTELLFDHESHDIILDYMQKLEPEMRSDGRFSDNMLRGVIGKAEKQIFRLACVIHASEQWAPGKRKLKKVSALAVAKAIEIFDRFKDVYVAATSDRGMAGDSARLQELVKALGKEKERLQKKHRNSGNPALLYKTTVRELRTGTVINSKNSIIGSRGDATQVIKDCLPDLVSLGFCAFDGKNITINPNL